jgi:hypothetical protein
MINTEIIHTKSSIQNMDSRFIEAELKSGERLKT